MCPNQRKKKLQRLGGVSIAAFVGLLTWAGFELRTATGLALAPVVACGFLWAAITDRCDFLDVLHRYGKRRTRYLAGITGVLVLVLAGIGLATIDRGHAFQWPPRTFRIALARWRGSPTNSLVKLSARSHDIIRQQATGLVDSTVSVQRAFYFHESRWFTPQDGRSVLAVDATFRNVRLGFDLDDVTLIDGQNETPLCDPIEWEIQGEEAGPPANRQSPSVSVRLYYLLKQPLLTIRLSYWQQSLMRDAFAVENSPPK